MPKLDAIDVLVADDHTLVRTAITLLVDREQEISVVGGARNGKEAYERAVELKPDVLLMDIALPQCVDGIASIRSVTQAVPETKVLVLTAYDGKQFVLEALRAGASGYVNTDIDDRELVRAIRTVADGSMYLQPKLLRYVVEEAIGESKPTPDPALFKALSEREQELFAYITKGYSNKEISQKLYISVKTVEAHKKRIMDKLHAGSLADLMEYSYIYN